MKMTSSTGVKVIRIKCVTSLLLASLILNAEGLVTEVEDTGDNQQDLAISKIQPAIQTQLLSSTQSALSTKPSDAKPVVDSKATSTISSKSGSDAKKKNEAAAAIYSKIEVMPTFPLDGTYAANDGNVTCVLLKAGVRFTFTYNNVSTNNQTVKEAFIDLAVHNYTVEGHCLRHHQRISIIFNPALDSQLVWNLTLNFERNSTDKNHIYASLITLQYSLQSGASPLPWAPSLYSAHARYSGSSTLFSMREGSSFLCMSKISLANFTTAAASTVSRDPAAANATTAAAVAAVQLINIRMYGVQLQAFKTLNNTLFSDIIVQCEADSVRFTVPIIVGILLLILILTVLVVFIIRRRMIDRRNSYKEVKH